MRKILIADDSMTSREILRKCVTHWHYEPVMAEDGQQAWDILSGGDSPVLAILDWVMPFMTGPEICRRVRALHGRPYVYMILLSGKDTKAEVIEGLESGADDCVAKPFDQLELQARLGVAARILDALSGI